MPERALKIIGVDQETNLPVHIALTFVLGEEEKFAGVKLEEFAAPRGFIPTSMGIDRPNRERGAAEPMAFAAPRGFRTLYGLIAYPN